VALEVIRIQEALTGTRLEAERLLDAMLAAFAGDPHHLCTGRSAPARLARALQQAESAGIQTPVLRGIADRNT
jgi:hypothetical protein